MRVAWLDNLSIILFELAPIANDPSVRLGNIGMWGKEAALFATAASSLSYDC